MSNSGKDVQMATSAGYVSSGQRPVFTGYVSSDLSRSQMTDSAGYVSSGKTPIKHSEINDEIHYYDSNRVVNFVIHTHFSTAPHQRRQSPLSIDLAGYVSSGQRPVFTGYVSSDISRSEMTHSAGYVSSVRHHDEVLHTHEPTMIDVPITPSTGFKQRLTIRSICRSAPPGRPKRIDRPDTRPPRNHRGFLLGAQKTNFARLGQPGSDGRSAFGDSK